MRVRLGGLDGGMEVWNSDMTFTHLTNSMDIGIYIFTPNIIIILFSPSSPCLHFIIICPPLLAECPCWVSPLPLPLPLLLGWDDTHKFPKSHNGEETHNLFCWDKV